MSQRTDRPAPGATVSGATVTDRDRRPRRGPVDPGVEGNARLTAATGLLLLVMLAAEGLTLVSVGRLLSWHVAIGLALVPPTLLKLGSTSWRIARYYLHDVRYRRAGPPIPLLRVLGPLLVGATVVLLGSGVVLVVGRPAHGLWLTVHQASFVAWFGLMTIHVLAHVRRAVRLAGVDALAGPRSRQRVARSGTRQGLVALSLVAGVILAVATRGASHPYTSWLQLAH